jgi:hypothetical protein
VSDLEQLLEALRERARERQRLPIEMAWAAFRASIRGYTSEAEARPYLERLLRTLADEGFVTLPRGKRLWDFSAVPPLPGWIQVHRTTNPKAPTADHRSIPWPPELAFVASMTQVALLEEFLAIKRFLADGGRRRRLVPVRERSMELFGDEKRLDDLKGTAPFREGRLSLELLRCHEVAPPLVWAPGAGTTPGRPVLVLENLHTYESFRRWNRQVGAYAAIAYGHGHEFKATCRDLPRLCAELETGIVHYFGDLDQRGLAIPIYARRVVRELDPRIELLPAVRWYEALLARAAHAVESATTQTVTEDELSWLPTEQHAATRELLDRGLRLPQELIGTDVLESASAG